MIQLQQLQKTMQIRLYLMVRFFCNVVKYFQSQKSFQIFWGSQITFNDIIDLLLKVISNIGNILTDKQFYTLQNMLISWMRSKTEYEGNLSDLFPIQEIILYRHFKDKSFFWLKQFGNNNKAIVNSLNAKAANIQKPVN